VIVVQNRDYTLRQRAEFVDQHGQDRFDGWWLRRAQHLPGSLTYLRFNRSQGGNQVVEEDHRIVVPGVERDPWDRRREFGQPRAQERGLAKAGGR
jgi:hypothetical protein